jgi:hypothetical protein
LRLAERSARADILKTRLSKLKTSKLEIELRKEGQLNIVSCARKNRTLKF